MTRLTIKIVLVLFMLFMTTIQPALAEIKVVYESKEKVYGLCKVRSITPIFTGLANAAVQKNINQILSKEIEDNFVSYLQGFETSPFCKEGVGSGIDIQAISHLSSKNLISISIHTAGAGVHPWYERETYNFDPHTGKKYSLTDLIPAETMDWIKQKIKQEIEEEKHRQVDDLDSTSKQYFEEYLEVFYITGNEIIFDFNTVLFSHAAGPTYAKIKLRELALRLPKDSLLFKLAMEEI